LNQVITLICKPGVYYGQCSELCGVSHGFMPIVVQAVPYDVFIDFVRNSKFSPDV
jgi:cytochrome c oxidase subunit 2